MGSVDSITKTILLALAVVLALVLGLAGWFLLAEQRNVVIDPTAEVSTAVAVATVAATEPVIEATATLPSAVVVELPTDTPPPATATPLPTDTPPPTATPTETPVPPTNTAVFIAPTATPIPPTNTPPPPTAIPIGVSGLVASNFALQDRSSYSVNGQVWLEFTVSNSTGGEVPYNALGFMPRRNGVDIPAWYAQTYGGPNARIRPGGLTWENHIRFPEPGDYTVRLVICFDGFDNCLNGGGTWHTLSEEIPVSIR